MDRKKRNYWNYETCKNAALECKKRGEFWGKYPRAASMSSKNMWLDEFFGPNTNKCAGYWTFENCYAEAKKYTFYTTFRDESFTVYDKCMKNGWIKKFNWLYDNRKKYDKNSKIHKVYVYVFENLNSAYIGRTIQIKQRHYTHTKGKKKDSLKEFIVKNNLTNIKMPIILEENLTMEESKIKEQFWIDEYKKMGYELINKVKGGSVGGLATKWTKDACYNEALKYSKRIDFYNNSPSAWISARKNGWLKDYTWLTSRWNGRNYWTYEKCYDAAKKCNCSSQMENKYPQAYRKARVKKWVKNYTWFKRPEAHNKKWTYEKCKAEIVNFSKKTDLPYGMYNAIKINNWLELYDFLKK